MNYAGSHPTRPAGNVPLTAETIRRIRLSMAAIVVLVVVALGALGGRSDFQAPDQPVNQATEQPGAASELPFDGRGKWTGYAR